MYEDHFVCYLTDCHKLLATIQVLYSNKKSCQTNPARQIYKGHTKV